MANDNILKIKNMAIAVFLVAFAIVIIYLAFGPIKRISNSYLSAREISVSAEGKVVVSPDVAKVYASVITQGKDTERIAQENNKKVNDVIDFLKNQEISDKDIKTTQYNLVPRYEYDEKSRKTFISGYELTQTVLVKIRDFEKIGKILGELPSLGANQISSVSFDIDDSEKYLTDARNQAFDKAKIKAQAMADKVGVRLGRIINFSEYQGTQPVPYYETFGKGGAMAVSVAPSIEPGTQEVSVQVNIIYEIK